MLQQQALPQSRIKHKEGERFTMLTVAVVVALSLVCCSAVSAEDEWTEQQVQQSKQWKDARAPLILTKSGTVCACTKVKAAIRSCSIAV
jgi:hypothetical protein